jgi:hypothetical protein
LGCFLLEKNMVSHRLNSAKSNKKYRISFFEAINAKHCIVHK